MSSVTSLGSLSIRVIANADDAATAIEGLRKAALAAFAVGAARGFAQTISAAVKNSLALDQALAQVNTISEKALDPARVRALSDAIGIQAVDAANALYIAYSSGARNFVEATADVTAAATLARTTQTSLGSAVKAVTGLMNAYASKGYDAAKITDILFQAAKDGVGSMDDFEAGLAKVVPTANILGLSLEEITAELAASTVTLKSAPAAATGLSQVFNELSKSSTGAGKLFKDTFGHTFQQDLTKTGSGLKSIQKLVKAVGQNNILDAFHAKGSGNAVELLVTQLGDVNRALKDTQNSSGTAAEALDKVNKSVSGQFNNLTVHASNALGSLGDALKPLAQTWLPILDHWITELSPHLVSLGNHLNSVAQWLANNRKVIEDVAGVIALRLIPVIAGFATRGALAMITGLGRMALAFAGLGTSATVAAAEVAAANASMEATTLAAQGIIEKEMVTGQMAFFGLGESAVAAEATTATASAGMRASFAGLGASIVSRLSLVGTTLLVVSAAWDMFGLKAKTGEGFFSSAVDGIKYDAGKMSDGVLSSIGNVLGGFGLFDNGVSRAFNSAGTASGNFANKIISDLRQVDADVYDSAGHIIQNLNAVQQAGLMASGALTMGSDVQKALANGGQLQADYVSKQGFHLVDAATVARQKAARDMASLQKSLAQPGGAGDIGGGEGGGALDSAGDKAKQAADKIKTAKDSIVSSLAGLQHASKLTHDQLDSLFADIEKQTRDVLSGASEKAALKMEAAFNKSLDKDADKLAAFKDKVTAELQFGTQVKQMVRDLGSVATATQGVGQTFFGVYNNLRKANAESAEFYSVYKKLEDGVNGVKLNDVALGQLAAAGPASLDNARAILSGGAAGIAMINQQSTALDTTANKIANKTADNYYNAGQSVSKGFLAGIQSQEKELETVMDKLGQKAAKSLKKALGISSPSKVMAGLGSFTAQGFANGIMSGSRKVEAASAGMGGSVVFGAGSVVVSHAPGDPMKAGTLTGRGITSVLERNKAQRALGGVG